MKRGFDIISSLCGLLVLSPLLILVALVIKVDSAGPVFFRQERIGRGFRPFWIYKFRTMVQDAPQRGGALTTRGDSRITRVGHMLRQTKIDELPQLMNVLRGDMSLVGPRPEVRRYVELFRDRYEKVLAVRPGITDPASLKYRNESAILGTSPNPEQTYIGQLLPDKLRLAEEYVQRGSFIMDAVILVKTFRMLTGGKTPKEFAFSGQHGCVETDAPPVQAQSAHQDGFMKGRRQIKSTRRMTANPLPVGDDRPACMATTINGARPRLLFVVDEDHDFCTHRLDLGRAARKAGFEVLVATHVQRHGKQIVDEGFKLLPIQLRRGVQSPFSDFSALIELIRLYREHRPDILHHVALKQVLFGSVAARISRVPAVVNAVTGLGYMFQSGSSRRTVLRSVMTPVLRWGLAHSCSAVIFQNKDDCNDFIRTRVVKSSQAVVIRGAGVNVTQFWPSPEPNGVPVVVLASRMLRDKGVGEFVEAARLLKSNGTRARCVLVGMVDKDNPSSFTEVQLRRWEDEGIVEWWGHRDDMTDVFASSHVVVLPSYAEGLPKVLLEAAACARPLIATRVRGCTEIVKDGENGLLVPPRDSGALAQAVMTLVRNKALRDKMGARGREIVEKEFTVERIAGETITLYSRLLANGKARSLAHA